MHGIKPLLWRQAGDWYRLAYLAAVGCFIWSAALCYVPRKGFTGLIHFGGNPSLHRIRELGSVDYSVDKDTYGYDGQYYAQLAVKPLLRSRDLRVAEDNLPYRARRILFSWTAYGLGLGRPWLVLQAFALQNILCWVLLAWLATRWFPPTSLDNLVRWLGVMFSWGMTISVHSALMDGPSLLLIAIGVMLAEKGRRWASACVLGVAGLGRETNVLAAVSHLPGRDWSRREVLAAAGRGIVIIAPLALWGAYLWWVFREPSNAGSRNFDLPFRAYYAKWAAVVHDLRVNGWTFVPRWTLLMMVSLTVQFLAIVACPRWTDRWWRIGAAYAVLMAFLGDAVWEGYPGAAARVIVPMTMAFNVVVPRGRWWWAVLVLGNLSALSAVNQLTPLRGEAFRIEGPTEVWSAPAHRSLEVIFDDGWYQSERSSLEYWRWSRGSAGIVINNPQAVPVEIELDFDLRAIDPRTVRVYQGTTLRWAGLVGRESAEVRLPHLRLDPGDNPWNFEVEGPPSRPGGDAIRPVTFNLRNLVIRAQRKLDAPPP